MHNEFKTIAPEKIDENPFKLIESDWMLITAGTLDSFNTMTANWGAMGELWHRRIAIIYVRPTRYTYQFIERCSHFTLSFFAEEHRHVLKVCGTKSGRDIDKMRGIGLTPIKSEHDSVYFNEARLVMECRKIYYHDFDPARFLDPGIDANYNKDYHRAYIGEVVRCMRR